LVVYNSSRAPSTHHGAHTGVAPAGQSPFPNAVGYRARLPDIVEHRALRWCKRTQSSSTQRYDAGVSFLPGNYAASHGTKGYHRQFRSWVSASLPVVTEILSTTEPIGTVGSTAPPVFRTMLRAEVECWTSTPVLSHQTTPSPSYGSQPTANRLPLFGV